VRGKQIDAREEAPELAAKAIRRRLKSENKKVVALTLTLCDVCIKNCSERLHRAFGTREFLGDVQQLTDGHAGYDVSTLPKKNCANCTLQCCCILLVVCYCACRHAYCLCMCINLQRFDTPTRYSS
jgi:VHS domain